MNYSPEERTDGDEGATGGGNESGKSDRTAHRTVTCTIPLSRVEQKRRVVPHVCVQEKKVVENLVGPAFHFVASTTTPEYCGVRGATIEVISTVERANAHRARIPHPHVACGGFACYRRRNRRGRSTVPGTLRRG